MQTGDMLYRQCVITDLWSVLALQTGDMLYLQCVIADLWSVLALQTGDMLYLQCVITDLWSVLALQTGDMLYLQCVMSDLWSVLALPKGPGYASCSALCQYLWHWNCRQRDQLHACTESVQQSTRCHLTRGARGTWQLPFPCTRNTIAFPEPDKRRRLGAIYTV